LVRFLQGIQTRDEGVQETTMARTKMKAEVRGRGHMLEEIGRILVLVEETLAQLQDPRFGLPQRMRLNLLRTELDAYVRGLRFALGEADESATPAEPADIGRGRLPKVS
jgi:hypothetical protein